MASTAALARTKTPFSSNSSNWCFFAAWLATFGASCTEDISCCLTFSERSGEAASRALGKKRSSNPDKKSSKTCWRTMEQRTVPGTSPSVNKKATLTSYEHRTWRKVLEAGGTKARHFGAQEKKQPKWGPNSTKQPTMVQNSLVATRLSQNAERGWVMSKPD